MTRMPQRLRKLVLTVHIVTSVGWLGLVLAMLVLGIIAATTRDVGTLKAAYVFMEAFANVIFPPAAVGTLLSGIILSAGTKWGLLMTLLGRGEARVERGGHPLCNPLHPALVSACRILHGPVRKGAEDRPPTRRVEALHILSL